MSLATETDEAPSVWDGLALLSILLEALLATSPVPPSFVWWRRAPNLLPRWVAAPFPWGPIFRWIAVQFQVAQVKDVVVHQNMSNVQDRPIPSALGSKLPLFSFGHQPYGRVLYRLETNYKDSFLKVGWVYPQFQDQKDPGEPLGGAFNTNKMEPCTLVLLATFKFKPFFHNPRCSIYIGMFTYSYPRFVPKIGNSFQSHGAIWAGICLFYKWSPVSCQTVHFWKPNPKGHSLHSEVLCQ